MMWSQVTLPEDLRCEDDLGARADGPMHGWFGLSYSSYLVIQRSLIQVMPIEWQARMVTLLEEMRETIDTSDVPSQFMVRARESGKIVADPFRDYRRPPEIPMKRPAPKATR